MSDLISRQAAIDAIEEYADRLQMVDWKENPGVPYKAYALNWCINTIRDLPPAQPEKRTDKCTETHACDLISRQAAVDAMEQAKEQYFDRRVIIGKMQDIVNNLPSAQPEIIRCRDCRYWGAYPSSSATPWLHECHARIARLHTAADEFCSRAERREVSE